MFFFHKGSPITTNNTVAVAASAAKLGWFSFELRVFPCNKLWTHNHNKKNFNWNYKWFLGLAGDNLHFLQKIPMHCVRMYLFIPMQCGKTAKDDFDFRETENMNTIHKITTTKSTTSKTITIMLFSWTESQVCIGYTRMDMYSCLRLLRAPTKIIWVCLCYFNDGDDDDDDIFVVVFPFIL